MIFKIVSFEMLQQPLNYIPTIHGHKVRRGWGASVKTLNPFHLHHSHYFYLWLPFNIHSKQLRKGFDVWNANLHLYYFGRVVKTYQTGVNQQTNTKVVARHIYCFFPCFPLFSFGVAVGCFECRRHTITLYLQHWEGSEGRWINIKRAWAIVTVGSFIISVLHELNSFYYNHATT